MALMSATSTEEQQAIKYHPEIYGRWVESAVGAHLINQGIVEGIRVFYWREGNHEVDFVIQKGNKTIGIEVKGGRSKAASGIPVFNAAFKPDKVLIIGRDGIPVDVFLKLSLTDIF